jgi:hypothetical protein
MVTEADACLPPARRRGPLASPPGIGSGADAGGRVLHRIYMVPSPDLQMGVGPWKVYGVRSSGIESRAVTGGEG